MNLTMKIDMLMLQVLNMYLVTADVQCKGMILISISTEEFNRTPFLSEIMKLAIFLLYKEIQDNLC